MKFLRWIRAAWNKTPCVHRYYPYSPLLKPLSCKRWKDHPGHHVDGLKQWRNP